METLQHILASFDISSLFSAIFPAIVSAFEKFFTILYESLFSGLVEGLENTPILIPVMIFLAGYFLIASIAGLKKRPVRIEKGK